MISNQKSNGNKDMPQTDSGYVIDAGTENCFLLSEGKNFKQIDKSYDQLRYYVRHGVINHTTGATVRLPSCRLTGGEGTSLEAWIWFMRELNGLNQKE